MGSHLVRILQQKGHPIYVTTRLSREDENDIKYLRGNAKEFIFLKQILNEHWDVIIDFMIYKTDEFRLRAEKLLNSTDQYVFLSSARVYANSDKPINEDTDRLLDVCEDHEYMLTDEYALSKARQEDILKDSGLRNWTIIRPYITYSEERLQLGVLEKEEWLYRALHGRTIVFSGEIASKLTTITYGFDVANALMPLVGNHNALGQIYNISNGLSISWTEVLKIYLNIIENKIGKRPKTIFLNTDEFLKCHPGKYQMRYDRLLNRQFDISKISNLCSKINYTSAKYGLKSCLEAFLKRQKFKTINWKLEAIKDRLTHEKTPFSEIEGFKQKLKYLFYRYFPIQVTNKFKI